MKSNLFLFPLLVVATMSGVVGANSLTIQNLVNVDEGDRVVCFDSASGKLTTCLGREMDIYVDCNTGPTIKEAIQLATTASGVALRVNISGTCNETLELERPNTRLIGDGTAVIQGQSAELGAVTVSAHNLSFENLTVSGNTGPGITVWPSGSLFMHGVTVTSNAGPALQAVGGKAVLVQNNTLSTTANSHAVVARESAALYFGPLDGNTASSPATLASSKATVGVYRGSIFTMHGNNHQLNNSNTDGLALKVAQGSHFRQEQGHAVFGGVSTGGGVQIINMSSADIRDVEITGDVFAKLYASLRLQDQNSDGSATSTVTGTTTMGHLANIDVKTSVSNPVLLTGDLLCTNNSSTSSGTVINLTVTGSDTCYP